MEEGGRSKRMAVLPEVKDISYIDVIVSLEHDIGKNYLKSYVAGTTIVVSKEGGVKEEEIQKDYDNTKYHLLRKHYERQSNGAFCAIASCIILHKIQNTKTQREKTKKIYQSQSEIFEEIVIGTGIIKKESHMRYGLTLRQVKIVFEKTGINVIKTVQDTNPETLHKTLLADLEDVFYNDIPNNHKYIVINFWRDYKEHKGGHISPIGAYDRSSGYALILDTNKYSSISTSLQFNSKKKNII